MHADDTSSQRDGATYETTRLDQLHEAVAVRRHGHSIYAPEGMRSWAQREHDGRAALDLVQRLAFAAGRAEGYAAGHRAGRRFAYQTVGLQHLADAIAVQLSAARRELAR